jgi:CYTH domain-containing protein
VNPDADKDARIEYERRFLVSALAEWRCLTEPCFKTLEDKYLRGTRLRLRRSSESDSGKVLFKLNKKAASSSPYCGEIIKIPLTPGEYAVLAGLEGTTLRKIRHYHRHRNRMFSIDVFEGELAGLVLCEVEAQSLQELMEVEPPPYVEREVTGDDFFTGGKLCQVRREELQRRLPALAREED